MGYVSENLKDLQEEFPNALKNPICGAQCGSGWKQIIREALMVYEATGATVAQIKEKFGGLRIYYDPPLGNFTSVWHAVATSMAESKAEDASWKICEDCGASGSRRSPNGWLRTQCDKCFEEEKSDAK